MGDILLTALLLPMAIVIGMFLTPFFLVFVVLCICVALAMIFGPIIAGYMACEWVYLKARSLGLPSTACLLLLAALALAAVITGVIV